MRTIFTAVTLAAICAMAWTSPIVAATSFDSVTGFGFFSKGDVQIEFGWNNNQFQAHASHIFFTYDSVKHYSATCEWITGPEHNRKTHQVSHHRSAEVFSALASSRRFNPQGSVTGFHLNGFGSIAETGTVPVEGEPCPGHNGHGGVWSDVELVHSEEGLKVHLQM
jgi:hypothetical protein